jgi:hypothetical protein
MEMKRIEPNTYSFVTKDGYEHMAIMMEDGKYKGVAWGYTKINIPEEKNGKATLSFEFEILENAGLAFEDIDEEEFMNLMGDILADQIDERMETEQLVFTPSPLRDDPL